MNIKNLLTSRTHPLGQSFSHSLTQSSIGRTTKRAVTLAVLIGGMLTLPQVTLANAPANAPIHEAGCGDWSADWGCTSWSDCVVYTSLHMWHCTYSTFGIITGQSSGSY